MGEKDPLKNGVNGGNTKQKRKVESPGAFTEEVERSKGNPSGLSQCLRLERASCCVYRRPMEPHPEDAEFWCSPCVRALFFSWPLLLFTLLPDTFLLQLSVWAVTQEELLGRGGSWPSPR